MTHIFSRLFGYKFIFTRFIHYNNKFKYEKNKFPSIYCLSNIALLPDDHETENEKKDQGYNSLDLISDKDPGHTGTNLKETSDEIYNITKEHYEILSDFIKDYKKDPMYVYKTCIRRDMEFLIVLKRLPGTITDENRETVVNNSRALHHGNKFEVVMITDVNSPFLKYNQTLKMHKPYQYDDTDIPSTYQYEVGKIVESQHMDYEIGSGIIFFTDFLRAVSYRREDTASPCFTGVWNHYLDNGQLISSYNYEHGRKISSRMDTSQTTITELKLEHNPNINIIVKVSFIVVPYLLFTLGRRFHILYKSTGLLKKNIQKLSP